MNFICSVMVVVCLTYLSGIVVGIGFDRKIKDFNPKPCKPKYGFYELKNGEKGLSTKQYDKTKGDWINLLQSKTGPVEKAIAFLQSSGEIASWATALAFIVSGITNMVSVISPAVGLFSWIAGLVVSYKDNKEKAKFVGNLQGALASISNDMSLRFENMKHYVDASTIDFEESVLGGEFQQMFRYVSDCMEIDELPIRSRCLVDRCSYVRAGFNKFAIYYDELSEKYAEKPWNYEAVKAWEYIHRRRYNKLTALQVKRIQANMPMFANYVQLLLIPCEAVKVFYGVTRSRQYQHTDSLINNYLKPLEKEAQKEKMILENMIYNYMNNVNQVILAGYKDYGYSFRIASDKNPRRVIAYGGSKEDTNAPIYLKCRMRMNPMNLDTCDINETVDHKTYTYNKKKYNGNVDAILKDLCTKWTGKKSSLYSEYYGEVVKKIREDDKWHKLSITFKKKLKSLYIDRRGQ